MEDDLPYMEPPYWYPTTRHYLGAALLDMGRSVEAEAVYRRDLEKNPNDGWSLQGLAQSLTAQGKGAQAAEVKKQLEVAFIRADVAPKSSRY